MDESRIPTIILRWDVEEGCRGWMGDIRKVCEALDIPSPVDLFQTLYCYDLDLIERTALVKCKEEWHAAAHEMSKQSTYIKIKDFTEIDTMVNLPREQRSIMSKFVGAF